MNIRTFIQYVSLKRLFALVLVALCLLYEPILNNAFKLWMTDENYAYCVFILPICSYLIWEKRETLATMKKTPILIGIFPLGIGLLMAFSGYQMGIIPIAIWSLVPVLSGVVLMTHGFEALMVLRFPIGYMLFAGSLPSIVFGKINGAIQQISTVISAKLMSFLGFTVSNVGNQINVPGLSVEVADACGGYRKMVVLIAFVILFCYFCRKSLSETIVLILLTVPIAIFANSVRICALIAVGNALGVEAFNVIHIPADFAVLILAFYALFYLIQRLQWQKITTSAISAQ